MACCQRYGRAKTTIDDVARAAGVSRALVYAHFGSRQGLLRCLGQAVIGEHREITDDILRSDLRASGKIAKILALCANGKDDLPGADFLDKFASCGGENAIHYQAMLSEALVRLVGRRDLAELLVLSTRGLQWDQPSRLILCKRIKLLAELGWQSEQSHRQSGEQ